jgi:hydroxymethylbilane synthase
VSHLRIATRRSPLALWQAEHVAALLRSVDPALEVELVSRHTAADLDLSTSISQIGGKGAFSNEIQDVVLAGEADIAVHSAKDLQAVTPPGLTIGAYPERGTVHDCLVGARLAALAPGATVATGSARRRALLLDLRPDLNVVGLRGNIGTRLSQLPEVGALVMAAVALERLGEQPAVLEPLDPEHFVPQVGQGALAVECRIGDRATIERLAAIDHPATRVAVNAERSFLIELGGDCNLPAGAHAMAEADGKLTIRGVLAASLEGTGLVRAELIELPSADPGRALAQRLRAAVGRTGAGHGPDGRA